MNTIKKIVLILIIIFITSILTTIASETNIPYLMVVPPLTGAFIIYKVFKNKK